MLDPGCPSCRADLSGPGGGWTCETHGPVTPLWRPREASYDDFAEHLRRAGPFPTFLPWPLGPGWHVSDFGVVGDAGEDSTGKVRGTVTCSSGTSALDGPVDVFVVSEEPGTGLGARVAGLDRPDPSDVGEGPSITRVRLGTASVPLWAVSTSGVDGDFDRYVVVGEAGGRWLWLVLRPASAMLLLRDEWILRDVSGIGPPLVELPFAGPAPAW
jgi:hypothetical protein